MGSVEFKNVVFLLLCPALNGNLVSIVLFMIVGSTAYSLRDSQLLGLIAIFLHLDLCLWNAYDEDPVRIKGNRTHKKSLSSYLLPQEGIRTYQCDQRGFRFSYGQGSFRMFQSESESHKNYTSKSLILRFAPCDQRGFRNVPSNVDWVRTSTSAPGRHKHNPSAHGGFKPYKPVKLKF